MSDPILDLIARYPNCRVTIRSGPYRPRPKVGDRRHTKRYGWQVRRRQKHDGMDCSRRGKPVYEWVRESSLSPMELASLRRLGEWNGARTL